MRRIRAFLALVAALAAAGCSLTSRSYPPPAQRSLELAPREVDPPFVEMSAADARDYIVRDIDPDLGGGTWRWTQERPELRFVLNSTEGQKLAADFGVVAATLAQTGPVTVSFRVNGRPLGQVLCSTPGDRHFERPVPAAWLSTQDYTRVEIQADKLFVAPRDGAKLGFTLHRAGFIE